MDLEKIVKDYISEMIAKKVGEKVGLSEDVSKSIIDQVITVIINAMRDNAKMRPEMTAPLFSAIKEDHDGSVLDDIDGTLDHMQELKGDKIIGHILGDKAPSVGALLAKKEALDELKVKDVMETVAPLAMGVLGKERIKNNMTLEQFEKNLS